MGTVLARLILAGFANFAIASAGASAAPDPADHTLSTTARISLTIAPSATIGRVDSARGASFFVRGTQGEDIGSVAQVIFTDGRGERTLKAVQDVEDAVRQAVRSGEDRVDVTFVF